jgi:hypothetical protein
MVISKTSTLGMANNMVRFYLLITRAIACEMGVNPMLESIINAIIRPNNNSVLIFLTHNMVELEQFLNGIGVGVFDAITQFQAQASSLLR